MFTTIKPGQKTIVTNETSERVFEVSKARWSSNEESIMAFEVRSFKESQGQPPWFARADRLQEFEFQNGTFEEAVRHMNDRQMLPAAERRVTNLPILVDLSATK